MGRLITEASGWSPEEGEEIGDLYRGGQCLKLFIFFYFFLISFESIGPAKKLKEIKRN